MEYNQSRFTNKTQIQFQSDGFSYMLKDRSGTRNNYIKYGDVFLNQQFQIQERSEYFRNIGFIWLILGVVLTFLDHSINYWVYIGLICLAIYYYVYTKYTVIPTTQSNIFVIHDQNHDDILNHLTKKVREYFLEEHGEINFDKTFEEERKKYKYLLDAKIIGDSQFNEYLEKMETNKSKFKN